MSEGRRLIEAEGSGGPRNEGFRLCRLGLAPESADGAGILRGKIVEQGRQLAHRLDFVNAGCAGCAGSVRAELLAGVALHAHVARGQEKDLAIGAGRARTVRRRCRLDEQRGSGLIPAGEVVEVSVLAVGHEVELGLFGGEEDGDSAIELFSQAYPASVVVGWVDGREQRRASR